MRAARVFASMVALSLLGGATAGWAQLIPGIPGIPGVMSPSGSKVTPPLQPFTGELKALTGSMPTVAALCGTYSMTSRESRTAIENITVRDFTSVATLTLFGKGTYELVYWGYWGPAQLSSDPRFNGVEVKEQGRFSVSSAVVLLEPERTMSTRTRNGVAGLQEILGSKPRPYVARVTTLVSGMKTSTQSLTMVGRCPPYQLDSACQHGMTVQYVFTPNFKTLR